MMRLKTFMQQHPYASVVIVKLGDEAGVLWEGRQVRSYSRRRDAVRALKNAGFIQEGVFWRPMPRQEMVKPKWPFPTKETENL